MTYRCALVSPNRGQCLLSQYHDTPHAFDPNMPWTETLEELREILKAAAGRLEPPTNREGSER